MYSLTNTTFPPIFQPPPPPAPPPPPFSDKASPSASNDGCKDWWQQLLSVGVAVKAQKQLPSPVTVPRTLAQLPQQQLVHGDRHESWAQQQLFDPLSTLPGEPELPLRTQSVLPPQAPRTHPSYHHYNNTHQPASLTAPTIAGASASAAPPQHRHLHQPTQITEINPVIPVFVQLMTSYHHLVDGQAQLSPFCCRLCPVIPVSLHGMPSYPLFCRYDVAVDGSDICPVIRICVWCRYGCLPTYDQLYTFAYNWSCGICPPTTSCTQKRTTGQMSLPTVATPDANAYNWSFLLRVLWYTTAYCGRHAGLSSYLERVNLCQKKKQLATVLPIIAK